MLALHFWWFRGLVFASFDGDAARVQGLPVRFLNAFLLGSVGAMAGVSARALGAHDFRIAVRHVLPNIAAPVIVLVTVYLSTAILSEAALSFLGLGTQPPEASWGGMLSSARSYLEISPWLSIFPGLAIMVVVLEDDR